MPVNERILKDGTVMHEARINRRNTKNMCHRFKTRKEAKAQLRIWEDIIRKNKKKKVKPTVIDLTVFKALSDYFLLGVKI